MSQHRRNPHTANPTLKVEDRKNIFKQANNIILNSHEKEFENGIKTADNNKSNGSMSSSKDIVDKIRYFQIACPCLWVIQIY